MVDQKLDKDQLHYPPQPQQQVLQDCEVVVALGRVNDLFTKKPVDMCVFTALYKRNCYAKTLNSDVCTKDIGLEMNS